MWRRRTLYLMAPAVRSEAKKAGEIELTVMPCLAHSTASALVRPMRPLLDAEYEAMGASLGVCATLPSTDEMLMILPGRFCSRITSATRCVKKKAALRLIASKASHSSSVTETASPAMAVPALFTGTYTIAI